MELFAKAMRSFPVVHFKLCEQKEKLGLISINCGRYRIRFAVICSREKTENLGEFQNITIFFACFEEARK